MEESKPRLVSARRFFIRRNLFADSDCTADAIAYRANKVNLV
jgi:hypothetical protein